MFLACIESLIDRTTVPFSTAPEESDGDPLSMTTSLSVELTLISKRVAT